MTENALFRLSSISKPIVATAAMVLIAQGKLGLDEFSKLMFTVSGICFLRVKFTME